MIAVDVKSEPETITYPDWDGNCDWIECTRVAVEAFKFYGQPGHVHDCAIHAAWLREWSAVETSAPLPPCPFEHTGETWVIAPRSLE